MFALLTETTRTVASSIAAVTIVSLAALTLDQGHIAAAPAGVVEIGELTPVDAGSQTMAMLPEVNVKARRDRDSAARFAGLTELPEVVVVASRVGARVAKAARDVRPGRSSSARSADAGVLLK